MRIEIQNKRILKQLSTKHNKVKREEPRQVPEIAEEQQIADKAVHASIVVSTLSPSCLKEIAC